MSTGHGSRWSRRFVAIGAGFLVIWRAAELFGVPRRVAVVLALYGFVLHVVFGMGYLLIPSYFERELVVEWAPGLHLVVATTGVSLLAADAGGLLPGPVEWAGALAWCVGVVLFLGTLLWTVRDNPLGRETGTSDGRAEFRRTDRFANQFVPVALAYLAVGSYELLARASTLPGLTDGYAPRVSHLLAAGVAAMLVFALGVRLAPRFLGVPAPRSLVATVLPAGALGPALVAGGLPGGTVFVAGAVVEAVAVVSFAVLYASLLVRSDRAAVGSYGVLGGAVSGVLGVGIGLSFAFGTLTPGLVEAHRQANLLGFLGLTIVGVAVQFFPPRAGRFRGASDRSTWVGLGALGAGLVLSVGGGVVGRPFVALVGEGVALAGASGVAYLLVRLLVEVGGRQTG